MLEGDTIEKPKPSKKGNLAIILLDLLIIVGILGGAWYLLFYEPPVELADANVELFRFSDLKGWTNETNETLNVEIWIKNTGEKSARGLSVFVRARNQNGSVLYMDLLALTWEILDEGETCSATYTVDYGHEDEYIEHTIEIRSTEKMRSYLKKTDLI